LALYFAEWCNGTCTPFYLRLPQDGVLALKYVRVVKTYVQFVILLFALTGDCNWLLEWCMEWITLYIWLWPPKVGQSTDTTKVSKLFNILLV